MLHHSEGSRQRIEQPFWGGEGERPRRDMIGWANDARNRSLIAAVGHRRWLLNPFATYMSYGQVNGYAV